MQTIRLLRFLKFFVSCFSLSPLPPSLDHVGRMSQHAKHRMNPFDTFFLLLGFSYYCFLVASYTRISVESMVRRDAHGEKKLYEKGHKVASMHGITRRLLLAMNLDQNFYQLLPLKHEFCEYIAKDQKMSLDVT